MTNFERIREMSIEEMADVFEMREYFAVTFNGTHNSQYKSALNWLKSKHYNEIRKLHRLLEEAKIPHEFERLHDGFHVVYPSKNNQILSAIEHYFSYGNDDDKIEIMGLLTDKEKECDDVKGNLTAENVFERIKTHYEKNKKHQADIIGEIIGYDEQFARYNNAKCSNCGYEFLNLGGILDYVGESYVSNYCPNCGYKLRKRVKDNDQL